MNLFGLDMKKDNLSLSTNILGNEQPNQPKTIDIKLQEWISKVNIGRVKCK